LFSGDALSGLPVFERMDGDSAKPVERQTFEREKPEEEGAFNVLAVGVDRRPDGDPESTGVRADALMLARVFPETGEVRLVSIPRDLFIEISLGVEDRVNAAYAFGGIEQTVRAVEDHTGAEIDNHAVADFKSFKEVVNAMGGVEVDVAEGGYPAESGIEEGRQRLSGRQALLYARYRGTPGGDLDRMDRQREILSSLRAQAFTATSVVKLPKIARVAGKNTSTDLGFEESVALGRTFLSRGGDAPLETGQLSGEPTTLPDGREVLIPDDEANRLMIEDFLR
jgi:LCP family protein required for cell wall assembly